MDKIILRGHHLLCTRLFSGNGYHQTFTEHMKEIVVRIGADKYKKFGAFPQAKELQIICGTDDICGKCPNLSGKKKKYCILGNEDVQKKDRLTLEYAGLLENGLYTLEEAEKGVKRISREQFEEICGSCRWYGEYCRYEELF
ncbi:MAG: DUF1284 domain-containing protein [Lachnospiraceae bacterium]|nr:DUF1284 domain-containing protein [Lachnospiraceae bacterium]MCI8826017.1 DUF1284 domain-containing protein [Lachnospiraceae bacterium]MCI9370539.1 DUF1284 domain-containing protein [Lachnospiraceae bacterium]